MITKFEPLGLRHFCCKCMLQTALVIHCTFIVDTLLKEDSLSEVYMYVTLYNVVFGLHYTCTCKSVI